MIMTTTGPAKLHLQLSPFNQHLQSIFWGSNQASMSIYLTGYTLRFVANISRDYSCSTISCKNGGADDDKWDNISGQDVVESPIIQIKDVDNHPAQANPLDPHPHERNQEAKVKGNAHGGASYLIIIKINNIFYKTYNKSIYSYIIQFQIMAV